MPSLLPKSGRVCPVQLQPLCVSLGLMSLFKCTGTGIGSCSVSTTECFRTSALTATRCANCSERGFATFATSLGTSVDLPWATEHRPRRTIFSGLPGLSAFRGAPIQWFAQGGVTPCRVPALLLSDSTDPPPVLRQSFPVHGECHREYDRRPDKSGSRVRRRVSPAACLSRRGSACDGDRWVSAVR